MIEENFESTCVLGVRVDLISLDELIRYVLSTVQGQRKAILTYVNVHAVNLAYKQGWFKDFINQSQVVFCDGFGVKWAAKFLHGKELQRYTPPDWFGRLAGMCAENEISIFFLGTRQDVIEKAAAVLKEGHPRLKIAGVHHGFFNKEPLSSENQEVLASINGCHADILVVGFGMPAQEKWILDNWGQLHASVVIPVGAFFDCLAGDVVRAPRWMTDNGLEWLGRLIIEPRRLWKRYILGNPLFLWRVLLQKLKIRE
ncbi:MAG TPA: WecB/TagA/CpsF family glycosyltransferase [Anaerolineaceae bacterium]|nr:WecB/TagA/CpsF family glycosyltransferase [Anaerolineaceae bacterium]